MLAHVSALDSSRCEQPLALIKETFVYTYVYIYIWNIYIYTNPRVKCIATHLSALVVIVVMGLEHKKPKLKSLYEKITLKLCAHTYTHDAYDN